MVARQTLWPAHAMPVFMRRAYRPVHCIAMDVRFCDDFGVDGFGWVVDEAGTRTSHALAADGKVWFVDALDWPEAIDRALQLGEPAGVIQLLDRHNRDCAALASKFNVPHVVVPEHLPKTQFGFVDVIQRRYWRESALWWPEKRTLVVAEALGTNRFYTGGSAPLGVHVLLRLTPPKVLGGFEPERILVGHGEGIAGPGTAEALHEALRMSRRRLPGVVLRLPFATRAPSRPR
jgi:hypothetical protein